MGSRRRWWSIILAAIAVCALGAPGVAAEGNGAGSTKDASSTKTSQGDTADGITITSTGPLTEIQITRDLNCAVSHAGDTSPEFYGTTACGTLVAAGGTLFGPAEIPAGGNASPRTAWVPQSQTMSGTGSASDPFRVVTVVTGGYLLVTQVDLYVAGDEYYSTRIEIENADSVAHEITLYRAGDCYLQDSDYGYGSSDPSSGAVACTAGAEPSDRIEQWASITQGSHFFEANYAAVWSRIGAQLPFPDTSEDSIYQDNGAGLSWTKTIGAHSVEPFAHLTTFSPMGVEVVDSDSDGFPDSWEEPTGGVDTNNDGIIDLKLSEFGATPNRADIFIQVGWTETRSCVLWWCSTTNRRPSLDALHDVQKSFALKGIRLHIDAGPASVMNPDTGAKWGAKSRSGVAYSAPSRIRGYNSTTQDFDWTAEFDGIRTSLLTRQRDRIFHFALYVGDFDGSSSGIARPSSSGPLQGRDFIVSRDRLPRDSARLAESGTFMHELGHNLGLAHGGSRTNNYNWKPNYPSVMNYMWQFGGVPKDGHEASLDYSDGTLSALNENSLVESRGLDPDEVAERVKTNWTCPGKTSVRREAVPSARNVNWNCADPISDNPFRQNLNNQPTTRGGDREFTELTDNDDWSSLVFDGGGALGAAGDPGNVPDIAASQEIPASTLMAAAIDHEGVVISGLPQQLAMRTGTRSPLTFSVTNRRDVATTYALSVRADGLTVDGLPDEIDFQPEETRTIQVNLTSGAVSDAAFFEIGVDGGDTSNVESRVTEVNILQSPVPDQPGPSGRTFTKISAGQSHTCAVTPAGGVQCWGDNSFSQLGNGTTTDSTHPVDVVGLASGVSAVWAGANHTCANQNGAMKCWGSNSSGQLGDKTTVNRTTPVQVAGFASGTFAITAGDAFSCAITGAKVTKCWGLTFGPAPVKITGAAGAIQITAGAAHACVVLGNRSAKCWGNNSSGQLGDGTKTYRTAAVQVKTLTSGVASIWAGKFHTCAHASSGWAKCWGAGANGQLGNGTLANKLTPVTVSGMSTGVVGLRGGLSFTCAVKSGRDVWCWGRNTQGQLGNGTTTQSAVPALVSGFTGGTGGMLAAGTAHACVLNQVTSQAYCWGANDQGQLGDGTLTQRLTPTLVAP